MYLDHAENQSSRGNLMTMADWVQRLDSFLTFNEYEILNNSGEVSKATAKRLAETEYDKFRPIQDKQFESDFDREIKKLQNKSQDEGSETKN